MVEWKAPNWAEKTAEMSGEQKVGQKVDQTVELTAEMWAGLTDEKTVGLLVFATVEK